MLATGMCVYVCVWWGIGLLEAMPPEVLGTAATHTQSAPTSPTNGEQADGRHERT